MNEELVDLNVNNPGNKKFKLLFYILLGVFHFTIAELYNKYSSVESAITNKNYELQNQITKLNYEVEKANQQFLSKQNELKSIINSKLEKTDKIHMQLMQFMP